MSATPAITPADAAAGTPAATASRRGHSGRWRQRFLLVAPTDRDTVTLRHRRIYILPTRTGLALIATVGLMLVTSLNYALSLGFAVTFLLTGVIATTLLATFRNLSGLEVQAVNAGESFAGGTVPFTLALAAGAFDRARIVIERTHAASIVVDVAANALLPITIDVPAPLRGRIPLGRLTIVSRQPLGLWRAWSYVHFPLSGIAYPAPEPSAPPLPVGPDGNGTSTIARGEADELTGLRVYRPGDPPQRIAWKTVARGAGWQTKHFEGSADGDAMTLDWNALPAAMDADARAARLAAWVLAADRMESPYALVLPGSNLPAAKGPDHRRQGLTALALCSGVEK